MAEEKLPRILIIIDEAQKLFVNYQVGGKVNALLSEIVRQGRAFGLHFLLSSQTFKGVDIENDVKNEMPLRIAFKLHPNNCSEIMDYGNDAPAYLKLYEIIYNSENGIEDKNVKVQLKNFDKATISGMLNNAKQKHTGCIEFSKLEFQVEEETDIDDDVAEGRRMFSGS
jgi:hypothetical protein